MWRLRSLLFQIHMTSWDVNDVDYCIMTHERQRNLRNYRKLPSIPPICRQQPIPPTYSAGVERMKDQRADVDNAMNIVGRHPNLIETKSFSGKMFNFVSNIAFPNLIRNAGLSSADARQGSTVNVREVRDMNGPDVPTISVSEVPEKEEIPDSFENMKTIYVCGIATEEKWTKLVLSLSQNYFVQCTSEEPRSFKDVLRPILHSDDFIFLMNNNSLCSNACMEELETALEWGLHIIYIREPHLRRPSKLQISKLPKRQHTREFNGAANQDEVNHVQSSRANHLRRENGFFSHRNNISNHDDQPSTPVDKIQPVFLRPMSTKSALSYRRAPSCHSASSCRSAPDAHIVDDNSSTNTDTSDPRFSPNILFSTPQPTSTPRKVDILKAVQDGFSEALIYESNHYREVVILLRSMLGKPRNERELTCKASSGSTTPTPEGRARNHFDFEETALKFAPEPEAIDYAKFNDDFEAELDTDPLSQESQETVYLIYSNEPKADSPKVFHWPSDCRPTRGSVPNSPSVESFGFEDIDLSVRVNNLELADSGSD